MQTSLASRWLQDPKLPAAPPMDVWNGLTPSERHALVEALPFAPNEELDAMAPEGTRHEDEATETSDRLRQWFGGGGRQAFVAKNLRVFYPNEPPFDPDVLVVLDAARSHRDSWFVANEGGRGLDVVIEVVWKGSRHKDLVDNVARFARLGIPEYYVVDLKRGKFYAYHLASPGAPYQSIPATAGRVRSPSLGLDLVFDGRSLRFLHGISPVFSSREAHGQLQVVLAELSSDLSEETDRADREAGRADSEKARADSEKARAEALERRLAELTESTKS